MVGMKTTPGATRRFLPGSPFNNMPACPPVELFDAEDQVTHDSYGLGRVLLVEDDSALVVAFGSRRVRIMGLLQADQAVTRPDPEIAGPGMRSLRAMLR